jgi:hypothetical protein
VKHAGRNGALGVVLCLLAVAALVVPGIGFVRDVSNDRTPNIAAMLIGGGLAFLLGITGLALLAAVFLDGLEARREKRLKNEEPGQSSPDE